MPTASASQTSLARPARSLRTNRVGRPMCCSMGRLRNASRLGRIIGVPAGKLEDTIARSNAAQVAAGRPVLTRAPWTALGPIKAYTVLTDGGLAVTERLEVTGRDGQPIPGL